MTLDQVIAGITPADTAAMERAKARWDSIAKPLGSLGALEEAVIRIAGMTGSADVDISKRAVVVMCADNGVVAQGVTQTGQEVTAIVAENMSTGDTSVCAMARSAVAVNRPDPADVLDVLHKVGGLDIAGLAGVFLGGALCHTPVLVDGFISSVAALVAARLCPACKDYMLGSHASEEPASRLVLSELGLRPFLYAGMRLGEGTGAVAVMPLLDMGLAVYREMATFEDTNIEAYQPLG